MLKLTDVTELGYYIGTDDRLYEVVDIEDRLAVLIWLPDSNHGGINRYISYGALQDLKYFKDTVVTKSDKQYKAIPHICGGDVLVENKLSFEEKINKIRQFCKERDDIVSRYICKILDS